MRLRSPESTLALLRDPYRFIAGRAGTLGEDVFETRVLLRRTTCMTGRAAARLFYDQARFQRAGAAPGALQRTLFGTGGVQGLDGDRHRHRKAMFLDVVDVTAVQALADEVRRQWLEALPGWAEAGSIGLYPELQVILTRAVCAWAGVALAPSEVERRSRQLTSLFDDAGGKGPRHLRARVQRVRADRWAAQVIAQTRSGRRPVAAGLPARVVADHRDLDGRLLPPEVAAVELLNILRPTVATALYLTCVAHALEAHPAWRQRLADGDGSEDLAFVQEVRRHYPFFPAVMARVREDFQWHGHRFARGRRVLLDVYGTNHDPAHWDDPAAFDPERFLGAAPDPFGFIPQGGGDAAVDHRCPGEPITVRLMLLAVDLLARHLTYECLATDQGVDFRRLPALPAGGFPIRVLRGPRR